MSNEIEKLTQSIDLLCDQMAKQNDNAAHFQTEWRSQFAVRAQAIPPTQPANWLRDYAEYPMAQVNLRDVRGGLRDGPCAIWWTVEAFGRDLARQIQPGETSVGFGDAMGAGYLPTRAQIRIDQNNDRSIYVDVGTGVRVSLLTDQINVTLLVPGRQNGVNFAQQTTPNPVVGAEGEAVIDTTATVVVTCSGESGGPIGNRISTLTRTYADGDSDVPGPFANGLGARLRGANEGVIANDFIVPARARTVQFSVGEGAPPLGNFVNFLDNPVQRNVLATYFWNGADAIAPRIEIPRNASIISTAGTDADVTAFYELEL